jgi:hypothetical protein
MNIRFIPVYFLLNMDATKRVFQVSSDTFWGFRLLIDISKFHSIGDIVNFIKNDLKTFLMSRNLIVLVEKLESRVFHVHHPYDTYQDLLKLTNEDDIIYICDHC